MSELIEKFRFDGRMESDVMDVFNDKPNWKCNTWDDLKRLNRELLTIVQKFELLKDGEQVQQQLMKYLRNFEIIQEWHICSCTTDFCFRQELVQWNN